MIAKAQKLTVAVLQYKGAATLEENVALLERMLEQPTLDDAELISLPEVCNLVEKSSQRSKLKAFRESDDPVLQLLRSYAKKKRKWVHAGSLVINIPDENRLRNRGYMINAIGEIVDFYDKIHMFDVDLSGGESYRESDSFTPGDRLVNCPTPWGEIGLTICYDLRFPQLHRALAQKGARIIMQPAAFTRKTGQAHWHSLLKARAIETGCFIIAAAQSGKHADGRQTFGHSLIVDPWGQVVKDAGDLEEVIITAELDLYEVDRVRAMVPSLNHDRLFN